MINMDPDLVVNSRDFNADGSDTSKRDTVLAQIEAAADRKKKQEEEDEKKRTEQKPSP